MFDPDVLELCRECLVGAVLASAGEEDLALAASALSRDLSDTHGPDARELLAAAAADAMAALDASDLAADAFLTALTRLAWLHRRAARTLPAAAPIALS
jgi:hypothetical protein